MKHLLSLIFCLISLTLFAQSEAANWYFGFGAGIRFNQAGGTVTSLNDGRLVTYEGCTSISDDRGNLLFYTDGTTIWNKNHGVMTSGLLGDSSSTQSAIIVPKPNDSSIYYVFTVGSQFNNTGLHYSVVDMSQNNGLGSVTHINTKLLNTSSEKITAVLKDCISKSMWVVGFASEDGTREEYNTFHAFEVSTSGVDSNSKKSTFPINITDPRGYLKLSPDGTQMACANFTANNTNTYTPDRLFLYDFNTATGIVSNSMSLSINSQNNFPYGLEFSPNSQLLYVHASNDFQTNTPGGGLDNNPENHRSTLAQFDLTQSNIQASQIIIDDRQLFRGGLQLGPDGRIYRALSATYDIGLPYLGVINNPNQVGTACNYQHNAINLSPNQSSQGLPPFIQSLFNTQIDIIKNGKSDISLALCDGDTYLLTSEKITGATYTWIKDKAVLRNANTFDLTVNSSGHYEVLINPNNGDCEIEGQAYVLFNPKPTVPNKTLIQCDEDGLKDGITTFNLTEAYKPLPSDGTSNLRYHFYKDLAATIELNGNAYENTSNPQILYVKATDIDTGCFSFGELTLTVSITDVNDLALPAVCDDDGIEDGLHIFNLKDAEVDMLKNIPTIGLTISYYETYEDALLETNKLNTNYTNTKPYNQTIFARVENSNACYGISKVDLIVHTLPNIASKVMTYYCLNTYPEFITLNAGLIDDDPSNYTYLWSNGDTNYQTQENRIGTYTVTVTDKMNGCNKVSHITVESSNIATFKDIQIEDISENNTITVLVTGEGIYSYALYDPENNVYKPYQESPIFEDIYPGIYDVYVKDIKNNCGMVNNQISVIGYPKFFTPNNDDINDTWQIIGISDMFQPNTKITIYDRYGKLLKQLNPLGDGWDGLFNGEKLPSDDYWFSVTLQDGRIFKNHFSLKY
ncbi:T9SS type B sorting domain-containing protein [Confluentibacter sediminis]|uniref:T9SS type B sorting domain-containing protein n=1 Tax=Confluentibacter sediminis TaxID=2219045 RepID=UPI000DAD6694|nr:T9SS type B sorting domain-containing protein [Confluentibacter sediminis]